jgi:hypothetical protein
MSPTRRSFDSRRRNEKGERPYHAELQEKARPGRSTLDLAAGSLEDTVHRRAHFQAFFPFEADSCDLDSQERDVSAEAPLVERTVPVLDRKTYQMPVEGRKTAGSVLPSPS